MQTIDTPAPDETTGKQGSTPSFLSGLIEGIFQISTVVAAAIVTFQTLYGMGWLLFSAKPKHEEHLVYVMGAQITLGADTALPATPWIFAHDSQPALIVLGVVLLFLLAFFVFGVFVIAELGGWRHPRMDAISKWLST
jgi:hypothetical protein